MATIYSVPEEVKVPEMDFGNFDHVKWQADEEKFTKELKAWCTTRNGNGKYIGKVLQIPHADGYACYMLYSISPMELIHMPLGDAWDSPMVDGLTSKKILEMIDSREKLNKLFSKS